MPHTDHHKRHHHHRTIRPKYIDENLQYGLPIIASKRSVEILNREQETQDYEEPE